LTSLFHGGGRATLCGYLAADTMCGATSASSGNDECVLLFHMRKFLSSYWTYKECKICTSWTEMQKCNMRNCNTPRIKNAKKLLKYESHSEKCVKNAKA